MTNEHNPAGDSFAKTIKKWRTDTNDDAHSISLWDQGYAYGRQECADELEALAASHRERSGQGEAIGGVVAEQFDILRRIADRGKRIALQKEDGPQVDIHQHMLDEIERLAKMAGRPSQPADKSADSFLGKRGSTADTLRDVPKETLDAIKQFRTVKPAGQAVTDERKEAESAYSMSAFDYPANPIGSRDWCIYWDGWKAREAHAPEPATAAADALRWIMRFADKCKKPCGDAPESPTAIRNAHFATIGAAAAQGLGLVRGPSLAVPAAAVPDAMMLHSSGGITNVSDYMIGGVVRTEHDQFASGWNQCRKAMLAAAPNRTADAQRGKVAAVLKLLDNVTSLQASEDYGLCEAIELLEGESALSADRIRTVLKLLDNVTASTDDQADFLGQAEIVLENMLAASPEVSP